MILFFWISEEKQTWDYSKSKHKATQTHPHLRTNVSKELLMTKGSLEWWSNYPLFSVGRWEVFFIFSSIISLFVVEKLSTFLFQKMKTNRHLPDVCMPSFTSVFLFHKQQVICLTLAVKEVLNFLLNERLSEKKKYYCNITHNLKDKIICLILSSCGTALERKANEISCRHKEVSVLEWSETRTTSCRTLSLL